MAGTRNTIQKEIVMGVVRKMHDHPTADAIYEEVKKAHDTISRATVFRILKQMSQQGSVLRVRVPDGADRFDFRLDRHYHIRCSRCGRVDDVKVSELKDLTQDITDAEGYRVTGYNVTFDGICPDCKKTDNN